MVFLYIFETIKDYVRTSWQNIVKKGHVCIWPQIVGHFSKTSYI